MQKFSAIVNFQTIVLVFLLQFNDPINVVFLFGQIMIFFDK
jgi:hypothetical protein